MIKKKSAARRKLPHQGQQCRRGQPLYYDQLKKGRSLSLTDKAFETLGEWAAVEECSISELIERWTRGKLSSDVGKRLVLAQLTAS